MGNRLIRSVFYGLFLCLPLQASQAVLSHETLKENEDPFTWQNEKDFQEEMKGFTELAEGEFQRLVTFTIDKIDAQEEFFVRRHELLLEKLRSIIFNWLFEQVLAKNDVYEVLSEQDDAESVEECYDYPSSPYNSDDEVTEDSEYQELCVEQEHKEWQRWELLRELRIFVGSIDDFTQEMIGIDAIKRFLTSKVQGSREHPYSWLINEIIGGSLLTTEDFVALLYEKKFLDSMKALSRSFSRKSFVNNNTRLVEGVKDAIFFLLHNEKFNGGCYFNHQELKKLGITKDSIRASLSIKTLKAFLRFCVKNHDNYMVQQAYEGAVVEAYVWNTIGIPKKLLENIIDGLWFDYDWEQLDIADPLFVANSYKATLVALRNGACADDVKKYIVSSLKKLFTFNEDDFEGALAQIRTNYNRYVKLHDWLKAFIEWSIYCAYRREFAALVQLKNLSIKDDSESLIPHFVKVNKEKHLVAGTTEARKRALEKYTKVYLHEDTKTLVFKDVQGRRDELDMASKLRKLKQRGISYELCRPKGSNQNIFVPELYLILQKADGSAKPFFIEMPLDLEHYPNRPLTRHVDDKVFEGDRAELVTSGYFAQPKQDYINGRVIQGCTEQEALEEIEDILASGTRNQLLIHSERVIMELLRKRNVLKKMVTLTVEELLAAHQGAYIVHGVVMLAYSTNSVCPRCTPTLISLMNSHEEGFLHMLTQELHELTGDIQFLVPLSEGGAVDWEKFRCNVFVTAKKNFDHQAHDMTEQDQQFQKRVTHLNTKARLRRPDNEFVISEVPHLDDTSVDRKQRCFYEFVGKERHVHEQEEVLTTPYAKAVFSSGGAKIWKKVPGYS